MRLESTYELSFKDHEDKHIDGFLFTNPDGLQSDLTYLNGKLLRMKSNTKLPSLTGVSLDQPVHIPSKCYGFLVIRNARASACL